METFVSKRKLFEIDLPQGWHSEFEDNLYTFQYDESSAIQISAMFHPGGKEFIISEELGKQKEKHSTAQITELSKYETVHYGVEMVNEKMLQYVWVTGFKNVKLLCTFTLSSKQADEKLDSQYELAVEILNTLKIIPPEDSK